MKSISELKQTEEILRNEVRQCSDEERRQIYSYLETHVKNADTYAALNYFFICGLHHFYLRKYLRGTINLTIMLLGIIFIIVFPPIGIVLLIGITVVELPQLFRSQKIIHQYNNDCMQEALELVKMDRKE